jgi:DNA-binding NtrC family response regulator
MDVGLDMTTLTSVVGSEQSTAPRENLERRFVPLREIEKLYIGHVLTEVRGNQRRAAKLLGISRWSLARRLRKHGLEARALRKPANSE